MKIYFLAAISAKHKYGEVYERIVKQLKRMRYEVKFDHILLREHNKPETYPEKSNEKYIESAKKAIRESDLVFAEVSHFTANMGYELSYSLENDVPVIAYISHDDATKISPFLAGNPHPLFTLRRYNPENLEEKIKEDMTYITTLANSQFTFTVTPNIKSYLEWNFKIRKQTRGLFIRLLIEKHMKEDKEFSDFQKAK